MRNSKKSRQTVSDPKILKRGRKTIYQLRPHLSQTRTTKYMPFTRKRGFLEKKIWANTGGADASTAPPLWIRHWRKTRTRWESIC